MEDSADGNQPEIGDVGGSNRSDVVSDVCAGL